MTAWLHSHIINESSYDLILVEKSVSGSKNYKWQAPDREPPDKIPARTTSRVYVVWADDLIGAMVHCDVTYEADVGGYKLRIALSAGAADTLSGAIPPQFEVSKPDILNVYNKRSSTHREIELYWTIKDWPD